MAVYQGARPRPALFPPRARPVRTVDAPALPRRRMRGAVRARRTGNRVGFVIGGIVLAFLLAFFWLAQTVSVSATSYDLDRLTLQRAQLESQRRDTMSNLNRLGREPAIRKLAIDAGLVPLPDPLVLPAR